MKKILLTAAATICFGLPAMADGYYEGKTIKYIIATSPGGNYDAYGRLVGQFLAEELGAENVLFVNLPGAGHIIGANTLAASEPDGLTIGTFNTGLIYSQILQREGMNFSLNDLSWVGKAAADARAFVVSNDSGIGTFEDLQAVTEPVLFAASGVGSASNTETRMLIDGLDLNVTMIPGYGGNEGEMAMLRGEVVGMLGSVGSMQPFVDTENGHFIATIGGDAEPQMIEFATTEKARTIVNLIDAMSNMGRLTAAPAGVDPAVLDELRNGYMAVMTNPDFLETAERLGLSIDPARGDVVAASVSAALQQSPETIEIIATAVDVEIPTIHTTSAIVSLDDSHKWVEFSAGDTVVKAKISGSRTVITIDGTEADRDQLEVGMDCEIEFDPNHEDNEPKVMDCSR